MKPRDIIARAWAITGREPKLRAWGIASALLETLLSLKLLSYQIYFYWQFFQGNTVGFFAVEEILLQYLPLGLAIAIVVLFLLLVAVEIFFPSVCQGAIIGLAAKSQVKAEVKGGLVLGLYNFFPLFVLKELFAFSGLSALITATTLIIRFMDGWGLRGYFIAVLVFLFFFSIGLRFLCSFAEEAVVIDKLSMFGAMSRSSKLIISHIGKVVFVLLLLLVISLRIVLNAVLVLLIPGIVIGLSLLLSTILPLALSVAISTVIGIGIIGAASYFFGYLHVFKQTVWTLTYLELKKEKDLDVIDT